MRRPFLSHPLQRAHQRNKSRVPDHDLALHYPTIGAPETPSNSFLIDPGYIKRYRDPSRHDSYVIPDHHHPYEFRTRPNATQALPKSSSQSDARRARLSMEQSWLPSPSISPSSSTLTHRHRVSVQPKTIPLSYQTKVGVCFPGSSSQYIGMGSFLESCSQEFKRTWEEAHCGLNEFEAWFKGLNLVESFLRMGYNLKDSNLLGGPIRPSDLVFTDLTSTHHLNRSLKDIVFRGPQNLLSHSVNAQPAILITSVAYLRSLEVEGKIPLRSITEVYAGHSSGEYTACVASDSIDFLSGIKLTRLYGLLSARSLELNRLKPSTFSAYNKSEDEVAQEEEQEKEATNQSKTNESKAQMSALLINEAYYHRQSELSKKLLNIKNSSEQFLHMMEIIRNFNLSNPRYPVEIASFNSSNQIVLSGTRAGVLAACARLQELEIANRAADLPCSSPFHSSFMKPASDGMKIGIESIRFKPPRKPILIAKHVLLGAREHDTQTNQPIDMKLPRDMIELKYVKTKEDLEQLKIHLYQSIDKPVWWSETVHGLLNQSVSSHHHQSLDHLLFVGPGKALKNLCNKQIGFDRRLGLHPVSPSQDHIKARDLTLSLATMEDFDQFFFLPG